MMATALMPRIDMFRNSQDIILADPAYDSRQPDATCMEDEPDIQTHLAVIRAARRQRAQRANQYILPRKNTDDEEPTIDAATIPFAQLQIRPPKRRIHKHETSSRPPTIAVDPSCRRTELREPSSAAESSIKDTCSSASTQDLSKRFETRPRSTDVTPTHAVPEIKNSYIVLTPENHASSNPTTTEPFLLEVGPGETTAIEVDEGYCGGYDENLWLANATSRCRTMMGASRISGLTRLRKMAASRETDNVPGSETPPVFVRNIPRMRKRSKKMIRSRASSTSSQEGYTCARLRAVSVSGPPIREDEGEDVTMLDMA